MKNAFAIGLLFCAACGGTASAPPPSVDVTGTWLGTWKSKSGASGTSTMTLTQSGAAVSGSVVFTGSPCFASGSFSGTVEGDGLSGQVTAGAIQVNIDGTVSPASMVSGTYDAISAGACTGDTGTFAGAD